MPVSDDFSSLALDTVWSVEGPVGASHELLSVGDDDVLALVTPDGNYDIWNVNNSVRAMQDTADTDFQLEARFLTTPTERYQMHGFLIEQDDQNWIRFDTYSDGRKLHLFAATTVDGRSKRAFDIVIAPGAAEYMRVTRNGDVWTLDYSADGVAWTQAGSFVHAMTVTSTGVFAGNTGGATGYTALVDYFENTADPLTSEDGVTAPNTAPDAGDDAFATDTDTAIVIQIADLLANDSDADGDALSFMGFAQPANGALTDNGDGTLTYAPLTGFVGNDSFTYTVSDGTESAVGSVTIGVTPPPGEPVSDDFHGGTLSPVWRIEGPSGISSGLGSLGDEAFLTLVTPAGNHDIWNSNLSARALQNVINADFGLETRFLSQPSERYEMQGILVEQDAGNWIRFDTYSDGANLFAFAAVTVNGSSSARINAGIAGGVAPYLRIDRAGDEWTFSYSADGVTWTVAGSFSHALSVSSVGPYAASTSTSGGFTAEVDYFFNTASPIFAEDGIIPPNAVPVAGDDAYSAETAASVVIAIADLLANDADANGDPISFTGFTQPANGTLVDNGDGTLTYTSNAGFIGNDSFTYSITDGTDSAQGAVTVGVTPPPGPPVSDDFDDAALSPVWRVEGPASISATMSSATGEAYLALTTSAGNHDIWGSNLSARALQNVLDQDFELEVKYLSQPSERYEMQGILVEQDASNWLRFDTYSDGTNLFAFGAATVNGSSSGRFNVGIVGGVAPYLRVNREGDVWTFSYSTDGTDWQVAGSFTHSLAVSAVGPFAGSTTAAAGFTAEVDYFFNTAAYPATEDGAIFNRPPEATDDTVATNANESLVIAISDLLANDTDGNGDPLSFTGFTQPANGTLTDNGDGTLTYAPNTGFVGSDSFTYSVADPEFTAQATVAVDVAPPPPAIFTSDDFSGIAAGAPWYFSGPAGSAAMIEVVGDAYLELTVPDGTHDAWGTVNAPRFVQPILDTDFSVEAKFLSRPQTKTQMQGLLVEQDAGNWIRFDVLHNGIELRLFAASTVNGQSSSILNLPVSSAEAGYLRISRTGDVWSFDYSGDGQTWATAGTLTRALNVESIGPFAANASGAPGFTAIVDYVYNSNSPLQDDLTVPAPPEANDDLLFAAAGAALVINVGTDLLANDFDQNGDPISLLSIDQPLSGTLTDNGDGTLTYTAAAGFTGVDSFNYTITDGSFPASAAVRVAVDNSAPVVTGESATLDEDTSVIIPLLANDFDPDGDAIGFNFIGQPANGVLVNNGDGTVTYTPNANYSGPDSFTYSVSDGVASTGGTVLLTVNPVQDAPVAGDDNAFTLPGAPITVSIAELLSNDSDADGEPISFAGVLQPTNGVIVDNGDGTLTYTPNAGFKGIDPITYEITDGIDVSPGTLNIAVSDAIEVWYGDVQTFGNLGETQQWVNVLGNVALPDIVSLSYTLNGGAARTLRMGGDGRRLEKAGDFNIELDYAELDPTAADDFITITAVHADGTVFTKDVTIQYENGATWAPNYSIDWGSVSNIQDVVQVVDGHWSFDANGVRPVVQGYDRILAIGDETWDFYEVNLTVDMHDLTTTSARHGSAVAFGMLWGGHTDEPVGGVTPHIGWENSAGFYFWGPEDVSRDRYYGWGGNRFPIGDIQEGSSYHFKIRLEHTPATIFGKTYSVKLWEEGTAEPVDWLISASDPFGEPVTGSFLLNAHYFDVTFDDLTVTEIEGSDIIAPQAGDDVILAVDTSAALPGVGEIDAMSGGAGADVFVLGNDSIAFYDDGNAGTDGVLDFAMIWDFETGVDRVRLHGTAADYRIGAAPAAVYAGDAIYRLEPGGQDEVIAIFNGVTGLQLDSQDFEYDTAFV